MNLMLPVMVVGMMMKMMAGMNEYTKAYKNDNILK